MGIDQKLRQKLHDHKIEVPCSTWTERERSTEPELH